MLFLSSNIMKHALRTVLFWIQAIIFSKHGVQLAGTTAVMVDTLQVLLNLAAKRNFMPLLVGLVKNLLKKFEILKEAVVVVVEEVLHATSIIILVLEAAVLHLFTTKATRQIIEF